MGAYEALARLYSRVGLWPKVVESLQRQAELTGDRARARALRLEVAAVYGRSCAPPAPSRPTSRSWRSSPRTVEALAALDRLTEAHGGSTIEDICAAGPRSTARTDRDRRRARILQDRLNNPEAAAGALRDLGAEALADDDLLAALLRNLRRAGLAHEAARVLTQRIEMERARKKNADMARITELNLELSLLRLDDLNDPVAARKEVDAALQASPDNPAALGALARLYLKENDFTGYSATRVREAKALKRDPRSRRGPARRRARLPGAAERAGEGASASRRRWCEDPTNAQALQALAAVLAAETKWDEARKVLARQLESRRSPWPAPAC